MNRLSIIFALLVLAFGAPTRAQESPLWKLVAQSDMIATGVLEFPTHTIAPRTYVPLPVGQVRVLKGSPDPAIVIRWFSEPTEYAPSQERLEAAAGASSLLFATRVEGLLYFAGHTPDALQPASMAAIADVEAEVARQDRILADWRPDASVDHYDEVRAIIDQIASLPTPRDRAAVRATRTEQQALFEQLISLGPDAVPAIIMQMDDRRPLAISQISLVNDFPGAFESLRHYGPRQVVDALEAVLNDITGQTFGGIHNGGTGEERAKAVRGWRIYLDHLRTNGQS